MKINDDIYGEEEISEQVLIDLINCDSIQRLKNVSQFGIPKEYYHKKFDYTRYEHTIGVFILLRKLGATLEEQIAGLLHDISHTAFSHVIDWVLGDPTKEDYQDLNHLKIISNSEIPKILKKHSFDYERISQLESFPLLERESPSLCADRVDYSLREIHHNGKKDLVKKIISNLMPFNSQIVFEDKFLAETFAREYMTLQKENWAGVETRSRYYLLSNVLKEALKDKLISLKDLTNNHSERELMKILSKSKNSVISKNLRMLKDGFLIKEDENGIEIKKKFRYVDPEIFLYEGVQKLSDLDEPYKKFIFKEKEIQRTFNKIKIIPLKNGN